MTDATRTGGGCLTSAGVPIAVFVLIAACGPAPESATFVGAERCGQCHSAEAASWRGSQHAHAMQEPTSTSILGHFDGSMFTQGGVTSTFSRRGSAWVANTVGPGGVRRDFDIRYTFGVYPLQQYLIALPRGRLQPLSIAWDARPQSEGGQRWFSLDTTNVGPDDEMHWSGRGPNWNYMCADCHSTDVRKNYLAASDSFHTSFSEVNVACESCHGPGSAHATWGARPQWLRAILWRDSQLQARPTERRGVHWSIDSTTGTARRSVLRTTDREIEVCAQCHSRRSHIADGYTAGARLYDFYDPFPLVAPFYRADGQQADEVYNYGSFLQSRMYAAGVTCSDCHEPHTQKLRLPGNRMCGQCHRSAKYDTTAHHAHTPGSAGAQCAACHMPTTTYMEIDPRHDHSLRIPRPDRTLTLGTPNACNGCHQDKTSQWAADQVQRWSGKTPDGYQRFAEAFAAADAGRPATDSLRAIVQDPTEPAVARAGALARLASDPVPATEAVLARAARDASPMVRRWALEPLKAVQPSTRIAIAGPLLSDSLRAVRIAAASALAPVADSLPAIVRVAFESAAAEFIASQRYNADRVESRVALATFYVQRGLLDSAEAELRTAVRQWPHTADAYVNLAGVLSLRGREGDAMTLLHQAITVIPGDPQLHHALGLSFARANDLRAATRELAQANRLSAFDPEFAYPYAVVLHGTGHRAEALRVLVTSLRVAPSNRDLLYALSTFHRDAGERADALRYAKRLVAAHPDDPRAQALVRALETAP